MITDERLATIAALIERAHRRMDTDRAFALVRACDELLAEVRRLTPSQPRLLDVAS